LVQRARRGGNRARPPATSTRISRANVELVSGKRARMETAGACQRAEPSLGQRPHPRLLLTAEQAHFGWVETTQ
jgi:hypothetical protein